jgi:flagellar biosynthesis protein FlhG
MFDQADDLRRLAMRPTRSESDRPVLLAIAGGKGGVGTTTAAIGLTVGLNRVGRRTLLVDADPSGGDAALHCGLNEPSTLADLLAGRRTWNEVIRQAKNGIRLAPGGRWIEELGHRGSVAAELLLELFHDPSIETDVAVIDVGNRPGPIGQRLCRAADAVVIVATAEMASIVGAFETIRSLGSIDDAKRPSLHLLVNRAGSVREAESVRHRLGRASRRLLGIELLGMESGHHGSTELAMASIFAPRHSPAKVYCSPTSQLSCFAEIC